MREISAKEILLRHNPFVDERGNTVYFTHETLLAMEEYASVRVEEYKQELMSQCKNAE